MLDFPASPTTGQTFTGPNGILWTWDSAKWVAGTTTGTTYAPIASPVFTGDPRGPTPAPGDNDTSIATSAFVQAAVAPALANVGRNLIHNPLFNIAQRGVSFPSSGYTLDRWAAFISLDTSNVSQTQFSSAGIGGDEQAVNGMAVGVTGNAGAGAFTFVSQFIENVRRLSGKTVTVSLWAYAISGTPKLGIGFRMSTGTGGSPSAFVDVNATPITLSTTPTRYSVTTALPSMAGATLGTNNDHSTRLSFFFSSGANTNTLAGGIGVQSGTFVLWGVQLEVGSVATPLEKPDPRYDLSTCQRFFMGGLTFAQGYGAAASPIGVPLSIPYMRATPTVTATAVSNTNLGGAAISGSSPILVYGSGQVTATGNWTMSIGWTASADL